MNLGGTIHINKTGLFVIIIVLTFFLIYINSRSNNPKTNEQLLNTVSLKKLLQVAIKAAVNGGIEVVSASEHDLKIQSKGKTKEGLENRVTLADLKSHCAMIATIKTTFPDLILISEEQKDCETSGGLNDNLETVDVDDDVVQEKDLTVWIDPLDATFEFSQQLHEYVTTMVCVAFKGNPIIGVIHNPFLKNTSWAWVGHGKSSNLKSDQLPSLKNKKKVSVIVSMSHPGKVKETLQNVFKDKELEIKNAAGAGYKVLQVASGLVDAYIHETEIKKWDICAGNAILNELGGRMTTKDGDTINYSDIVHKTNENGLIATLRDHEYFIKKLE